MLGDPNHQCELVQYHRYASLCSKTDTSASWDAYDLDWCLSLPGMFMCNLLRIFGTTSVKQCARQDQHTGSGLLHAFCNLLLLLFVQLPAFRCLVVTLLLPLFPRPRWLTSAKAAGRNAPWILCSGGLQLGFCWFCFYLFRIQGKLSADTFIYGFREFLDCEYLHT